MTQFNEREKAFENKFGRDEEFDFKIAVRAAKLFGRWPTEQMGLKGQEVDDYAIQVREIHIIQPGFKNVIERVEKDFKVKGIDLARHQLEKEMNQCENQTRCAL